MYMYEKVTCVERAASGIVRVLSACIVWLPLLAEVCIRSVLRCLYLILLPSLGVWVIMLVSAACVMVTAVYVVVVV
jgi:hypothetical protein